MIKPWLFEFFPELTQPDGQPPAPDVHRYFDRYLKLWGRDEELDFEGIFYSEHHFGRSFSPSPHLLIAAMAGRTSKLRLGVMGTVLPYYHPARLVEEIGMLDHLTGGRLEIGTAMGVPQELAKLNISMAEARERCDESAQILNAALQHGVVSHQGKHFQISELRLLPRPLQQPAPSVWMAVMGAVAARRAAQLRSKISTGFNEVGVVKQVFDAYREEASSIGFEVGPDCLALRRRVALGNSMEDARSSAAAAHERLSAFVAEDKRFGSKVPDAPAQTGGFKISEDEFITGTPKEVAGQIIDQCRATGAGNFLAVLHWSAPIDEVERAHELFGREVIPLLRAAAI